MKDAFAKDPYKNDNDGANHTPDEVKHTLSIGRERTFTSLFKKRDQK